MLQAEPDACTLDFSDNKFSNIDNEIFCLSESIKASKDGSQLISRLKAVKYLPSSPLLEVCTQLITSKFWLIRKTDYIGSHPTTVCFHRAPQTSYKTHRFASEEPTEITGLSV